MSCIFEYIFVSFVCVGGEGEGGGAFGYTVNFFRAELFFLIDLLSNRAEKFLKIDLLFNITL